MYFAFQPRADNTRLSVSNSVSFILSVSVSSLPNTHSPSVQQKRLPSPLKAVSFALSQSSPRPFRIASSSVMKNVTLLPSYCNSGILGINFLRMTNPPLMSMLIKRGSKVFGVDFFRLTADRVAL